MVSVDLSFHLLTILKMSTRPWISSYIDHREKKKLKNLVQWKPNAGFLMEFLVQDKEWPQAPYPESILRAAARGGSARGRRAWAAPQTSSLFPSSWPEPRSAAPSARPFPRSTLNLLKTWTPSGRLGQD